MTLPSRLLRLHLPHLRTFTTTPLNHAPAPLPPRVPLPEKDITISYLKGSGPGGQKINKTSSAVQIKHLPSGIVVKCQDTRSRDQNEKLALRRLQDRLEQGERGTESRVERRWEMLRKRKASKRKKAGRKYRALEEVEKQGEETVEAQDEENVRMEMDGQIVAGEKDASPTKTPREDDTRRSKADNG